ncbi:MAG: DNA mismatch repair endonuclease MutL [Oligosphaeraceae bacterium]
MGIIHILPAEVAGRIAAGEVIERPASVIKELVENSIDAGATRIRILTEQGGQRLIQVVDDGKGMDRQDAMLCLEAHATSKISQEGDVGQILSLGFRGEALPSISSVSRFELQTRPPEQLSGTEILVNHGAIQEIRECGCAPGTSIRVQWLFGNLPARRKFLKSPATEDDFIQEMVLMLALTRPQIAFELIQNGRTVFRAPAAQDIAPRVEMLVGKDAFAAMLPVEYQEEGVHVYGFIAKPGFTRSSRREQRIIVNGRSASAETIYFAIREAYDTLVLKGRYPGVVLYVDLPPDRVDVNVHPTKREVRFREPMRVSRVVSAALRQALRGLALPDSVEPNPWERPPQPPAARPTLVDTTPEPAPPPEPPPVPVHAPEPLPPPCPSQEPLRRNYAVSLPMDTRDAPEKPAQAPGDSPEDASFAGGVSPVQVRLLGPLGADYLLAESDSGLVVVGIRGASQRILFERLLKNLRQGEKACLQPLLMPVTLHLAPDESRLLAREAPYFRSLGFVIEEFGAHTFLVTAVPQNLPDCALENTIRDILTDLRQESVTNRQSAMHLAQLASRHGISRKGPLPPEGQRLLLEELMRCEMPYADPAGQPTMVHITYSELGKRFRS